MSSTGEVVERSGRDRDVLAAPLGRHVARVEGRHRVVGNERSGGGELGRFNQIPVRGEEADWPFASDFERDVAALGPGEYYPKTM